MIFSTCKACRFRPDILLSPDIEIAFGTKHCCGKILFFQKWSIKTIQNLCKYENNAKSQSQGLV